MPSVDNLEYGILKLPTYYVHDITPANTLAQVQETANPQE